MIQGSLETLYPWVVPAGYVEFVEGDIWSSWPVTPDIRLARAFVGDSLFRNAQPDECRTLGLDDSAALDCVAENLTKAFVQQRFEIGHVELDDGTMIGWVQCHWMVPAAGLLFGEFYEMLSAKFKTQELAAIIPNQELLIAFPADERTLASTALRALVEDRFLNHRKPVSRSWTLMDGGWSRDYPDTATGLRWASGGAWEIGAVSRKVWPRAFTTNVCTKKAQCVSMRKYNVLF